MARVLPFLSVPLNGLVEGEMVFLLGADVGTSSIKVVLFDEDLRAVAQARREYATRYPGLETAEHDPEDWLRGFCACTREILAASGVRPGDIAAVGIDGMSSLALPVDAEGKPLRPAMIWLDRRSQVQVEHAAEFQTAQLVINGNRSDPSCFAPKLAWLREQEPDVYRRASIFLHCNAYLVHRLTGRLTMDVSQAGLSLLCDIRTGQYSPELIEAWKLDRRKLPDVSRCSEVVGRVLPELARETGLAAGTPVIAGAMDNVAATVGIGLRKVGDGYIAAGTVTNVGILRSAPVFDGKGLIYHSGIEGCWLVNGGADYGGAGLLWFRDLLQGTDLPALSELGAATDLSAHPLLFLPYMAGQRAPLWNSSTTGVVLGITPGTQRQHLARMFMESVPLAARHVFEQLCSTPPSGVALTGGITNSPAWSQLVADVTGMRVSVCPVAETSTLGVAMLAGVGVGLFPSIDAAYARLPPGREYVPDERSKPHYEALYRVFTGAYCNVAESWRALSALRSASNGSAAGA